MRRIILAIAVMFAAIASNAQTLYPIDSIQYIRPDSLANGWTRSYKFGDTVKVRGVVRFNPRNNSLSNNWKATYIQDTAAGNWKGLNIRLAAIADSTATRFFDNVVPGNMVEVVGVVSDFGTPRSGETQIDLVPTIATRVLGFATPPAPKVVTVDQFMVRNQATNTQEIQMTTGEQFEGMYVEFRNVTVTDVSTFTGGRVSWTLQDVNGNKIKVRDISRFLRPPFTSSTASTPANPNASVFVQQGKVYTYVRGVIVETAFGTPPVTEYQLAPLDTLDLGPVSASPPYISTVRLSPANPTATQSVTVSASITDIDGTVASAAVNYRVGSTGAFTAVPMTANGNNWSAVIPAQADGSTVWYFISAVDNSNNNSTYPDSSATNSYYVVRNAGITQIAQIQGTLGGFGASVYENQTLANLAIPCVVTSTTANNDLGIITLQQGVGPYSAIYASRGSIDNLRRGDSILITSAKILEKNSVTYLDSPTFTYVTRVNNLPPYQTISMDSAIARNAAYMERWEAALLGFNNVFVTSLNPDGTSNFGEWTVYSDTTTVTTGMRCDDLSNDIGATFNVDSLTLKSKLNYIRGVMNYANGQWKLEPRNRDDIFGFSTPNGTRTLISNGMELKAFPNPSNGTFNLSIAGFVGDKVSIRILDLSGRIVYSGTAANNGLIELNTGLSTGLYMLQASSNGKSGTIKLVVE